MTYLLDRNKNRKRNIKIIFSVTLFLVVVFFWEGVRSISYPVTEPVLVVGGNVTSSIFSIPQGIANYFHSKIFYENKIKSLEQNIEDLENKIANDETIISNQDLLKEVNNKKILLANPVMRDFTTIYDTIILSKGFSDGVNVSNLVYIRGMMPVGLIEKVHDKTSELSLFSSSGNKVDGVLLNEKSITLIGNGGGNFIADLPKDFPIVIGDNIYYGPKGNGLLGTVSDIQNDIQDTFLKVYVKGNYNPMNINNFYIEKND